MKSTVFKSRAAVILAAVCAAAVITTTAAVCALRVSADNDIPKMYDYDGRVITMVNGEDADWAVGSVRAVNPDGVVYEFSRMYYFDGSDVGDDIYEYTFCVYDLRHANATPTDAESRDLARASSILRPHGKNAERDELLALDADSLGFESLDGELFLNLMREALAIENDSAPVYGRYEYERTHWQDHDVLAEKMSGGYAFQLGYAHDYGVLDAVFLDVRYERGGGYVLLSELVDSGEASPEQIELRAILDKLEDGMIAGNDLSFGRGSFDARVCGVDMTRLYDMTSDAASGGWFELSQNARGR